MYTTRPSLSEIQKCLITALKTVNCSTDLHITTTNIALVNKSTQVWKYIYQTAKLEFCWLAVKELANRHKVDLCKTAKNLSELTHCSIHTWPCK